MLEIILNNFYPISGAILLACFAGYIAYRNGRKVRLAQAAAVFRTAIDPHIFRDLTGHALHGALYSVSACNGKIIDGAFPKHKNAVNEFRRYLNPIERFCLNHAWNKYTGGNDDCPNFFVMYCGSENGAKLLKSRLEALRDVGNHT